MLGEWIEESARAVEELSVAEVSDLSPAELRVLQFLPGHLSYPQIAAETFVSPNTVKTQAQSIYRKLGASEGSSTDSADARANRHRIRGGNRCRSGSGGARPMRG